MKLIRQKLFSKRTIIEKAKNIVKKNIKKTELGAMGYTPEVATERYVQKLKYAPEAKNLTKPMYAPYNNPSIMSNSNGLKAENLRVAKEGLDIINNGTKSDVAKKVSKNAKKKLSGEVDHIASLAINTPKDFVVEGPGKVLKDLGTYYSKNGIVSAIPLSGIHGSLTKTIVDKVPYAGPINDKIAKVATNIVDTTGNAVNKITWGKGGILRDPLHTIGKMNPNLSVRPSEEVINTLNKPLPEIAAKYDRMKRIKNNYKKDYNL